MENVSIQSRSEPPSCWVCGSQELCLWKQGDLQQTLTPDNLRITDAHYGLTLPLLQCKDCGFIFAPEARNIELTGLYSQLDDAGYEESLESRRLQFRRLLDKVLGIYPRARSMLDIGAGMGLLMLEGKSRDMEVAGVEPSQSLVEAGLRHFGLEVLQGVFPHPRLTGRKFDLVFLVDVLEHVTDPVALLAACRDAINPGGALIVVTPDVRSLAARLLGKRWWHFRLAHVGYFDRETLSKAADKAGLKMSRYFRASWYFQIDYLADRLAKYLPISWINRLGRRWAATRWIYHRTIPLNLLDSWVGIFKVASEDRKK